MAYKIKRTYEIPSLNFYQVTTAAESGLNDYAVAQFAYHAEADAFIRALELSEDSGLSDATRAAWSRQVEGLKQHGADSLAIARNQAARRAARYETRLESPGHFDEYESAPYSGRERFDATR